MSDGSWEAYLRHTEAMNLLAAESEYLPFKMLAPKISKDGNRWHVLLGDDIQTGISGWGDTPNNAILAFGTALHRENGSCEIIHTPTGSKEQK